MEDVTNLTKSYLNKKTPQPFLLEISVPDIPMYTHTQRLSHILGLAGCKTAYLLVPILVFFF